MSKHRLIASLLAAAACCALLAPALAPPAAAPRAPVDGDRAAAAAPAGQPAAVGSDPAPADTGAGADGPAPAASLADLPACETDAFLASLSDGFTSDDLLASLAESPALSQLTIEKQSDSYVKLALPAAGGPPLEDAIAQVAALDAVESAQPNFRYYPAGDVSALAPTAAAAPAPALAPAALLARQAAPTANDPYYASGRQWPLASVNAPDAWSLVSASAKATSAVTVAVIDAGFVVNHQDLKAHVVDYYNVAAASSAMGTDNASHGTHVAGIVGAVTNNGKGVASVANNAVGLMLLRVSNSKGEITSDVIVDSYAYLMKRAQAHNVRVVNMSLGSGSRLPVTGSYDAALYKAIAKARSAGIVTVAAACNEEDGWRAPFYAFPSDFDNVVSVINLAKAANSDGVARDPSSNYARSSSRTEKNISAPGTGVYSTYSRSTSSYTTMDGTSMAAPLVAGVLGLMFTVNPELTAAQATSALYGSAKDLAAAPATAGWDRYTGWGEVDAAAAVRAAGATATLDKTSVASLSISAADATFTGKALKPKVTVRDGSTTLVQGVDYTVAYRDNKAAGKAAFTVRGKGAYCGIAVGTFTIKQATLKSAALKAATATYNAKSHKPALKSVKTSSGAVSSSNYAVTCYRNGVKTSDFKSVGVITVKVTGKNSCKGAVTKTFKIIPRGTSITKLVPEAGGFTVRWKKRVAQTTGYQFQLAADRAFTAGVKSFARAGASAVGGTVTHLKARKTYYVRVRTYATVNARRLYSAWSKPKAVKTR